MLVVSQNLVFSEVQDFPPWAPVVGWHNVVTAANVATDTEDPNYPAVNLATNRTPEQWRGTNTTEQRIVVTPDYIGEIDYVAVARHNFGTAQISVSVEVYTEVDEFGPVWVEVHEGIMPADNGALVLRFVPQAVVGISLLLRTGNAPPRASVLFVGKLLVLPATIQTEFTPLTYGRVIDGATNVTENGDYLGRLIHSEMLESSCSLLYLDPVWYREAMDPFIKASSLVPFFFAWDPLHWPREVGFAWIKEGSNPQPRIYENVGLMSITLEMGGISL